MLHCTSNHPELLVPLYSSGFGKGLDQDNVHPSEQRFQETLRRKKNEWETLGLPYELQVPGRPVVPHRSLTACQSMHLTYFEAGMPVKSCSAIFSGPKEADFPLWTHPNSWNHFLTDHIVTFAALPLSVDRTLTSKWLVAADAVEGVDYDLENLTKVWTQTNAQDQSLAEGAYRGICSGGYLPGPLADEEYLVNKFSPGTVINSQKPR